ncbi:YqeB family protein [Myceligenerans halotolerans]
MTTTRIRQSPAVPVLLVGGGTALGILLGLFGPQLARGLTALIERTPFPVHGLVERLGQIDQAWSLPILGGAGLLGGIFLAIVAAGDAPELEIARDHLEHRQQNREVWVERAETAAAFRDRTDLVLLGADGGLRARLDTTDLPGAKIHAALTGDGWPVRDDDPYDADFQPWADGRPGFTPEEHALLRERRGERKDKAARRKTDAALAEAGLVVRERGDRLQVRRVREGVRGADR